MSKDDFEQMMSDCYPLVTIMGVEFEQGTAMRKIDPVAFDEMYWCSVHDAELVGEEA